MSVEGNPCVTPLTPLRKIIAARMSEAKQTIPHYRISMDIEMDALLARRRQLNQDASGTKISVNDLLIKACADTLMAYPTINSQLIDDEIHQFRQADIAVVIAVEGGLSTPVVREADRKTVQEIADEVKNLSERARQGTLKMNEILGGTFSLSNLGMFGVDQFDAIINPPQGAILAVGSGEQRAVVRNGELTVATVISLTLSSDHRIIDGAVAAEFMSVLKGFLEQPATMLV